ALPCHGLHLPHLSRRGRPGRTRPWRPDTRPAGQDGLMTSTPPPRWFTDTQPGHSQWFIERFRSLEADGADLLGEARFADMLADRGSRILDAGCGLGRTAHALHEAGHTT